MKILLVNDYATLTGGAEVIVYTLCEGLRRERRRGKACFPASTSLNR
jgi:hypothetical protein